MGDVRMSQMLLFDVKPSFITLDLWDLMQDLGKLSQVLHTT